MHMVAAILVLWAALPLGAWWRALASLVLALTVLTTIGTGQHYLVDLVAALPLAVAAEASVGRRSGWKRRVGLSLALLVAWVAALRWAALLFVIVPGFTWTAIVATLIGVMVISRDVMGGGAGAPAHNATAVERLEWLRHRRLRIATNVRASENANARRETVRLSASGVQDETAPLRKHVVIGDDARGAQSPQHAVALLETEVHRRPVDASAERNERVQPRVVFGTNRVEQEASVDAEAPQELDPSLLIEPNR